MNHKKKQNKKVSEILHKKLERDLEVGLFAPFLLLKSKEFLQSSKLFQRLRWF